MSSLLVRLARAADPNNVERHTWKAEDAASSVVEHLHHMLAAKTGGSLTCPDYGVPDLSGTLHDLVEASAMLQRQLKISISAYEPRLKNVQVRLLANEANGHPAMVFEISGHILLEDGRRQALRIGTQFNDRGEVEVSEL